MRLRYICEGRKELFFYSNSFQNQCLFLMWIIYLHMHTCVCECDEIKWRVWSVQLLTTEIIDWIFFILVHIAEFLFASNVNTLLFHLCCLYNHFYCIRNLIAMMQCIHMDYKKVWWYEEVFQGHCLNCFYRNFLFCHLCASGNCQASPWRLHWWVVSQEGSHLLVRCVVMNPLVSTMALIHVKAARWAKYIQHIDLYMKGR